MVICGEFVMDRWVSCGVLRGGFSAAKKMPLF
jgi:hypothetical protein